MVQEVHGQQTCPVCYPVLNFGIGSDVIKLPTTYARRTTLLKNDGFWFYHTRYGFHFLFGPEFFISFYSFMYPFIIRIEKNCFLLRYSTNFQKSSAPFLHVAMHGDAQFLASEYWSTRRIEVRSCEKKSSIYLFIYYVAFWEKSVSPVLPKTNTYYLD